jgi:hypothetical protein
MSGGEQLVFVEFIKKILFLFIEDKIVDSVKHCAAEINVVRAAKFDLLCCVLKG